MDVMILPLPGGTTEEDPDGKGEDEVVEVEVMGGSVVAAGLLTTASDVTGAGVGCASTLLFGPLVPCGAEPSDGVAWHVETRRLFVKEARPSGCKLSGGPAGTVPT